MVSPTAMRSRNAWDCGSKCERLIAATGRCGRRRVRIGAISRACAAGSPGSSRSRSAPRPTTPRQIRPTGGAATSPIRATPSATTATLTVNSSRPARNSRVPSSGSTRMNTGCAAGTWPAATASSDTTGISGASRARPARITASAASSAMVTGDWSALRRAPLSRGSTATMAAAACDTMPVKSSRRALSISMSVAGSRSSGTRSSLPWHRRGVSRRTARGHRIARFEDAVPSIGDRNVGHRDAGSPRSCRAVVLAPVPRPDQPGGCRGERS